MTWEEINRKRMPYIRMGENLFRGMYASVHRSLLKEIREVVEPNQIQGVIDGFVMDADVRDYMERYYIRVGLDYAKDVQKAARGGLELKDEDLWLAKVTEFVRNETGAKITSVITDHYADIVNIAQRAVDAGISDGQGMRQIANAISSKLRGLEEWKALRIARTEVVTASSVGTMAGAEDLPGNKEKVWISTFDSRSRPEHQQMDGERVNYGDTFYVAGDNMRYPGDPNASAANVINCRCGFEVIIKSERYE